MLKMVILGVAIFGMLFALVLGVAFASPNEQSDVEVDAFEFLTRVLADANDKGVLSEHLQSALVEITIRYLIAPSTGETPVQVEERLSIEGQTGFEYLTAVLRDADGKGVWADDLSEILTDYFISNLISPKTGETPEMIRARLSLQLELTPTATTTDPFARWNELEPQDWWRKSEPYSCLSPKKETSPWIEAGMTDLGGSDSLSLIKYFGNGSYLRYGFMGFEGCTPMKKHPSRTHLDPPVDPSYYSLGQLEIAVDIARVPAGAPGWVEDDGEREAMTMTEAVKILNEHIATYYSKISEGKLQMRFKAGNDFKLGGDGSPNEVHGQQLREAGIMDCRGKAADKYPCDQGAPGGLNRILLTDVTADTGGDAFNGSTRFGLVSLRTANMETLVHEIGHAWMGWPHSYSEVYWDEEEGGVPNPYANTLDFMSGLVMEPVFGWYQDMPSTMAVNRYAAGWIDHREVALHLTDEGTYTLQPPRQRGYQFLVISSGREYAFTTVEVLDERDQVYKDSLPKVFVSSTGGERTFRYDGVLVSRYDQTNGSGIDVRLGPALYDKSNPDYSSAVNWGRDDYSVMQDGETREIGSGVRLAVSKNEDGSYDVSVSGGKVAEFTPWCRWIWFFFGTYDTGCALNDKGAD